MLIDLHTHTLFSDGGLLIAEQLRRASVRGYDYIGITDHCDFSNVERLVPEVVAGCRAFNARSDSLKALPGVELTHVHPEDIPDLVCRARELGAVLVAVHGETIVEPVYPGTNRAAIEAGADFLAHPGVIDEADMKRAAELGVFVEVTSRKGHCLGNGRTVELARKHGAKLMLNSDTHGPADMYTPEKYQRTALGAGLTPGEFRRTVEVVHAFVEERLSEI